MTTGMPSVTPERRRFRLHRRWLLWAGVVVMCIILIGAAAQFVRNARRAAHSAMTATKFRHAILDMRAFSDAAPAYDGVPGGAMLDVVAENGKRLLSWRVWLTDHSLPLPGDARADYEKPWDDSRNLRTASKGQYDFTRNAGEQATTILAITGPGTVFGDDAPMPLKSAPANMIVLVEVRNSGIHWMSPHDFDIRTMPHTINDTNGRGISGETSLGFHVAFADGEVWRLSHDTPFEKLSRFFLTEEAARLDREEILEEYRRARWPAPDL